MGGIGRGGGIGDRTHAGLVREEAALDAGHEGHAETRAEDGVEVEGAAHDRDEHFGHHRDVERRDGERDEDVGAGHDGNHHAHDLGDAGEAAEDHEGREARDRKARHLRVEAERGLHREADGVGLDGVEDEAVGNGEEHREDAREERGADHVADVVGGTAHEAAALARGLVDLGERGLDEARRGADRGDHPHPEDGAGAARGDRDGDAGDVAHAHAGGGGDAEGLEGRDVALARLGARALGHQAEHFGNAADLHEARADREPEADADQHHDEDVGPKIIVDHADDVIEPVHVLWFSFSVFLFQEAQLQGRRNPHPCTDGRGSGRSASGLSGDASGIVCSNLPL